MAALDARRNVNPKSNANTLSSNTRGGGTAIAPIYYGALLEWVAANDNAIPAADATPFAGIALQGSTTEDEAIPILQSAEISGLSIAGTPEVGVYVYPVTDNIADITQTVGTYPCGTITAFNGSTYTVVFKIGLS